MTRRLIGPPPLHERLEIYWRPFLIALGAACAATLLILWIRFGWPPKISFNGGVWIWCWMFGIMMVSVTQHFWPARLWLKLAVMLALAVAVITLVTIFALPVAVWAGIIPPPLPITPVQS